jgi:hypothetical protein
MRHIEEFIRKSSKADIEDLMQVLQSAAHRSSSALRPAVT